MNISYFFPQISHYVNPYELNKRLIDAMHFFNNKTYLKEWLSKQKNNNTNYLIRFFLTGNLIRFLTDVEISSRFESSSFIVFANIIVRVISFACCKSTL